MDRDAAPFVTVGVRSPSAPQVSVCVLVLADVGRVMRSVSAALASDTHTQLEVVVVANGVADEQFRLLEQREDVVVARSRFNLGFGGGNNLAAAVAKGRYLLFVNDDSTLEKGCVDRLVATAKRDPSIGAVGSRILAADGTVQEAGSVLWVDGHATHVGRGAARSAPAPAYFYVREVDYLSANGFLVRRDAWDHVGGFDERFYPAYYEDTDLCLSLRSSGYKVIYEPRATLIHQGSQSTTRAYREFLMRRNRGRFVAKWSDRLANLERRPGWADTVTIERAINRARGMPPRVLVDIDADPTGGTATMWETAAVLARSGWAVVASTTNSTCTALNQQQPLTRERLIDLGVDVRIDTVRNTFASVRDFEVVVTGIGPGRRRRPLYRADGSAVPVVNPARFASGDLRGLMDAISHSSRRVPVPPGVQ